jgi:hypothetical protein
MSNNTKNQPESDQQINADDINDFIKMHRSIETDVAELRSQLQIEKHEILSALVQMEDPFENGLESYEGTKLVSKNFENIAELLQRLARHLLKTNEDVNPFAIWELDYILPVLARKLPAAIKAQIEGAHGWLPTELLFRSVGHLPLKATNPHPEKDQKDDAE